MFLYLMFCAAEDEETQRRGLVFLMYHMGPLVCKPETEFFIDSASSAAWLPIRLSATHWCTDRLLTPMYVRMVMIVAGKDVRARFRLHEGELAWSFVCLQDRIGRSHQPSTHTKFFFNVPGTHTEVQYCLMTFGFPVTVFPMTSGGELKVANHLKWIKKRKVKDKMLTSFGVFDKVDMPNPNDVLVGKGKPCQQHSGNLRLRHLVELRLADYTVVRKSEKQNFTREIVQTIKKSSGRFLKRDCDGWWEEVPDEDAREKVSKIFGSTRAASTKGTFRSQAGPGFLDLGNKKRAKMQMEGCFALLVSHFD
jgi:hypothetical protein